MALWAETWFYPSVVDWMEADLNSNLHLTIRKGLDLSGLNDWRSLISRGGKSFGALRSILGHDSIKNRFSILNQILI